MNGHEPVMLDSVIELAGPVEGNWVDCTLGAGNCSRALIEAGARRVVGIDCDPDALEIALDGGLRRSSRFTPVCARFGDLGDLGEIDAAAPIEGIVFDLGVSSMQLDNPDRGFSFVRDGPLDMRMGRNGRTAADIVNHESEERIAEIFYLFGQERHSRRVARAVVENRRQGPISTTGELAELISGCMPPRRGIRLHPATRCFQALRIAVNDELGQLVKGLNAAERLLTRGGKLLVISFHSLEDRIVKRFMGGSRTSGSSRYRPQHQAKEPRFRPLAGGWRAPNAGEVAANPRSRSARLRAAERTGEPAVHSGREMLGLPVLAGQGRS